MAFLCLVSDHIFISDCEIIFAWELQAFSVWITDSSFPSKNTLIFSGLSLGCLVLLRALFQFFHHVLLSRIRENSTAVFEASLGKIQSITGTQSNFYISIAECITGRCNALSSIFV